VNEQELSSDSKCELTSRQARQVLEDCGRLDDERTTRMAPRLGGLSAQQQTAATGWKPLSPAATCRPFKALSSPFVAMSWLLLKVGQVCTAGGAHPTSARQG
jgi:hypothetical protein